MGANFRSRDGEFDDLEAHGPLACRGSGDPSWVRRFGRGPGGPPARAVAPLGSAGADSTRRNGIPVRPGSVARPADRHAFRPHDRGPSGRGRSRASGPPAAGTDPRPPLPRGSVGAALGSKGGRFRALTPQGDGIPAGPYAAHTTVRHRRAVAGGRPAARGRGPGSPRGGRIAIEPGPGGRRDAHVPRIRGDLLSRKRKPRLRVEAFRPGNRHPRTRAHGRPRVGLRSPGTAVDFRRPVRPDPPAGDAKIFPGRGSGPCIAAGAGERRAGRVDPPGTDPPGCRGERDARRAGTSPGGARIGLRRPAHRSWTAVRPDPRENGRGPGRGDPAGGTGANLLGSTPARFPCGDGTGGRIPLAPFPVPRNHGASPDPRSSPPGPWPFIDERGTGRPLRGGLQGGGIHRRMAARRGFPERARPGDGSIPPAAAGGTPLPLRHAIGRCDGRPHPSGVESLRGAGGGPLRGPSPAPGNADDPRIR